MFKELIKIVVCSEGQKFDKTYQIESDGAYDSVCSAVAKIVNRELPVGTVQSFFWQYA